MDSMGTSDLPDEGDLVVATVKQVKNFGVVVDLDEFPGKEGFIHIAEVASGWVKYIRDHVREGQKVVCKVLSVDEKKRNKFVDLSLKSVNEHQKREKIQQWKSEQKAMKLFELVCTSSGLTREQGMEMFGQALLSEHGSLYGAFEAVAIKEDLLSDIGPEGDWRTHFIRIARENITPPYVEISGILDLSSQEPRGMDLIKEALSIAAAVPEKETDVKVRILYISAPRYRMVISAPNYKLAEDLMREGAEQAISFIEKNNGTGKFIRKA